MKKLTCIMLALVVLLAFAACGAEEVKPSTSNNETTGPAVTIFTVTVIHSDGEESSTRLSTEKETLTEALIERTIMTEDMLTIGGEKADPTQNAYWTLYIDGVYATESWDEIVIEGGAEYVFEYTTDMELEGDTDGEYADVPAGEGPGDEIPEDEIPEDVIE